LTGWGPYQKLDILADSIIVTEHSFWCYAILQKTKLEPGTDLIKESLTQAKQAYVASHLDDKVHHLIRERVKTFDDEGKNQFHDIVCSNLMPRPTN